MRITSSSTNLLSVRMIWIAAALLLLARRSSSCLAAANNNNNIRGGGGNNIINDRQLLEKKQESSSSSHQQTQQRHYGFQSRIVGGKPANAKEFEFSVNLGGCGGSLIHTDIILTAAHCQPLYPSTVRIGGSTENNGLRVEVVGDGTPHPRYSNVSQDYDFMVYKLASPVKGYTPVPLNKDSSTPSATDALTVIGFGSIYEGGPGSFDLHQVTVGHYPHDQCNLSYQNQIKEDIMFCAGVVGGGKDSCQGDSGGPIIDQNGVQVGVTSWGNGCAQNGFPGVYARVSAVSDWVQEQVCTMSNNPPADCPPNTSTTLSTSNNNENSQNVNDNNPDQTTTTTTTNGNLIQPKGSSLRVEIQYDAYPTENAWMLYNDDTKEELYWSDYGDVSVPGLDTSVTFPDLDAGRYVFILLDNFNDGICCEHGNGYVKVYEVFSTETGGGEKLLWTFNGHFENAAGVAFLVDEEDRSNNNAGSSHHQGHGNISIDSRIDLSASPQRLQSSSSSSSTRRQHSKNHSPDVP